MIFQDSALIFLCRPKKQFEKLHLNEYNVQYSFTKAKWAACRLERPFEDTSTLGLGVRATKT